MTDAFWECGILISSAAAINAIPVAEYTLAAILFSLKRGWYFALSAKRDKKFPPHIPVPGAYGSTIGLVSLGMVGAAVAARLQSFDLRVLAFDPFADADAAKKLRVKLVSLEQVFRESDVISLHTPLLDTTRGMITGDLFRKMKPGATFINTSRGAAVREPEMIEALQQRPDLTAVLDVTDPEPPLAGSPFYTLPNVVLTPHIAGSMDAECRRMGHEIVEGLKRYLAGQPLRWSVSREKGGRWLDPFQIRLERLSAVEFTRHCF